MWTTPRLHSHKNVNATQARRSRGDPPPRGSFHGVELVVFVVPCTSGGSGARLHHHTALDTAARAGCVVDDNDVVIAGERLGGISSAPCPVPHNRVTVTIVYNTDGRTHNCTRQWEREGEGEGEGTAATAYRSRRRRGTSSAAKGDAHAGHHDARLRSSRSGLTKLKGASSSPVRSSSPLQSSTTGASLATAARALRTHPSSA